MKINYFLLLFILLAVSCKHEMTRDEAANLLMPQLSGYARDYKNGSDYFSVIVGVRNPDNQPLDNVMLETLRCLESKGYVTLSNVGSTQSSFAGFRIGPKYDNYKIGVTNKATQELTVTNSNDRHPYMSFPAIKREQITVTGIRKISDTENEITYTGFYSATESAKCYCNINSRPNNDGRTYNDQFDANDVCDVLNKTFKGKALAIKYDAGWKLREITESVDHKTKFKPDLSLYHVKEEQHNNSTQLQLSSSAQLTNNDNTSLTNQSSLVENQYIIDTYDGTIGKKTFKLVIEKINGETVEGYNETGSNKRPVKGQIVNKWKKSANTTGFNIILNEPGDNKWDGKFSINLFISDQGRNGDGTWKSYNGKLEHDIIIKDKLNG